MKVPIGDCGILPTFFSSKKDLYEKRNRDFCLLMQVLGSFACTCKDNSTVSVLSNVDGINPIKQANLCHKPPKIRLLITLNNTHI